MNAGVWLQVVNSILILFIYKRGIQTRHQTDKLYNMYILATATHTRACAKLKTGSRTHNRTEFAAVFVLACSPPYTASFELLYTQLFSTRFRVHGLIIHIAETAAFVSALAHCAHHSALVRRSERTNLLAVLCATVGAFLIPIPSCIFAVSNICATSWF